MATSPSAPTRDLRMDREETPTERTFRSVGIITAARSALLRSQVHTVIREKRALVLDLSDVTFLDGSGRGGLVSLWVAAQRDACELRIVSLSPRVKELLPLASLDKLFRTSRFLDTQVFSPGGLTRRVTSFYAATKRENSSV
jgi:anti-anti-sigma factor